MCGGAARGRGRVVLPLRGPAMSARTRMYAHLRSGLGVSRYALLSLALSLSLYTYIRTYVQIQSVRARRERGGCTKTASVSRNPPCSLYCVTGTRRIGLTSGSRTVMYKRTSSNEHILTNKKVNMSRLGITIEEEEDDGWTL